MLIIINIISILKQSTSTAEATGSVLNIFSRSCNLSIYQNKWIAFGLSQWGMTGVKLGTVNSFSGIITYSNIYHYFASSHAEGKHYMKCSCVSVIAINIIVRITSTSGNHSNCNLTPPLHFGPKWNFKAELSGSECPRILKEEKAFE